MSTKAATTLQAIGEARFELGGQIGARLEAVTEQWILPAPYANPAMLEMFRDRDRQPYRNQVPWAGEFAGKYLTHAVQTLKLTGDARLRGHIAWFVGELTALQDDDGYLGPWPKAWRLRRGAPNCGVPWDAWGHYHVMLGLLLWHEVAGDGNALLCAKRIGDLFCDRFLHSRRETMHDAQAHEMNQAPIHSLCLLYRVTGEQRYLDMALKVLAEFEIPPAGDYFRTGLINIPFHGTPKPRWESLHPIMGLVELYYITGDERYATAFRNLWWSMLEGDRHNNGGFTSGERATGNPYDTGAIETCCTVAWMAMSVEMLKLTGDSIVADELELSLVNSGLGMMSPSGRWVTYNTPMEGQKKASAHDIVFQARAGQPELNCCSVNGPRAIAMLCDWAVMRRQGGLTLNYYGPGAVTATLVSGTEVTLRQQTDYPRESEVTLHVEPAREELFALDLRIPFWSATTSVRVNGETVEGVEAGRYLTLERTWKSGDCVEISFDLRPHYWYGMKDASGRVRASVYRGPVLLAHDARLDGRGEEETPALVTRGLTLERVESSAWLKPWLLVEAGTGEGEAVRLCDFASAGLGGNAYRTWLAVDLDATAKRAFTHDNPLRSVRV